MSNTRHWDQIYSNKPSDKVGWYTPHLITPLNWIEGLNLDPDEAIIDVEIGIAEFEGKYYEGFMPVLGCPGCNKDTMEFVRD